MHLFRSIRVPFLSFARASVVFVILVGSTMVALASPVFAESAEANSADSSTSDGQGDSDSEAEREGLDEEAFSETLDDELVIDAPHIPPPSTASYLQINGSVNEEFVLGAEFGETKVNSSHSRFVFEVGGPLSRVASMGVRVRFGVRDFGFDGDGQFIDAGRNSSEPFEELFEYSMTLGARIRLIDELDVELTGRGIARVEEGASFTSGLEGGGGLSLLGRYQDWLVLRLGVALNSNFDTSSVHVSPLLRLRVRLYDRLWAETGGRSGRLEFSVTERLRLDLFGGIDGGRYRLDDRRDGVGGVGEGSLRLKQSDVGLAARLTLRKRLRIHLEAGVVLTQTLEIRDEDGDVFDERENRDPAFRGRIALKWRF